MIKKIKVIILLIGLLIVTLFWNGKFNKHPQSELASDNNCSLQLEGARQFLNNTSQKNKVDLKIFSVQQLPIFSKFENIFTVKKNLPIKTNQWFSSLYFSQGSENIFVLPLAVKFLNTGLSLSIPSVSSNDDLIIASAQNDIVINFEQEVEARVLSAGDFSVLVGVYSKDDKNVLLAKVMLAHGSPYIFVNTKNFSEFNIESFKNMERLEDGSFKIIGADKTDYGIFVSKNLKIQKENDKKLSVKPTREYIVDEKSFFTVGVVPKNFNWDEFRKGALNPIVSTKVLFLKAKDNKYINVFDIQTLDNNNTLWGLLPHQSANLLKENKDIHCFDSQFYETIRGKQEICAGKTFYIKSGQNIVPPVFLDVKNIDSVSKDALIKMIKKDTQKFSGFKATDTYFLGKELLRVAQLYDLAKQLDMEDESQKLKNILYSEFDIWRGNVISGSTPDYGKYIVYDNNIRGIVGQKPSFGSDEFNDHHFHYGYFVHTAAILARYDKTFLNKNENLINLFVKDYLNINRDNKDFAFLRNFDVYEGHSWASGTAMFGDGNNQESSSEAIHAYYAGYLWGDVIKNDTLKEVGLWLYNQEVDSALTYWLLASNYAPRYFNYKHSLLSLIWGGKSEFGTWFSGEPEAKLGIELLPFTAGSEYLKQIDSKVITKHLAETDFPKHKLFFDQLLMYQAIADPQKALELFSSITDKDIDGGNSKSFLYAWIISQIK